VKPIEVYCSECGAEPGKKCIDMRYARRTGTFPTNRPHRIRIFYANNPDKCGCCPFPGVFDDPHADNCACHYEVSESEG